MYDNVSAEQWIYMLAILLLVSAVGAWLFFRGWTRDEPPRDLSTGEIIENGIAALLHWRPHVLSSSDPADGGAVQSANQSVDQSATTILNVLSISAAGAGLGPAA